MLEQLDAFNAGIANQTFCSRTISFAKQCVPHGKQAVYKPRWDKEREALFRIIQTSTGTASDSKTSFLITVTK